jgi:hypothetical protein
MTNTHVDFDNIVLPGLYPYVFLDQGITANGDEWVKVSFSTPGDVWLTYDGLYPGMTQDFGELSIRIEP